MTQDTIICQPSDSRTILKRYDPQNGYRVVDVQAGKKRARSIPINDNGELYINKYLLWQTFFDVSAGRTKTAERKDGLRDVRAGRRLAFPANYTSDEPDMTSSAETIVRRMKKSFEKNGIQLMCRTDFFGDDDFSISTVLFREGCLADFFELEDVIGAYSLAGKDFLPFYSSMEELFNTPISEFAKQHLFSVRTVGEMYVRSDSFSFNKLQCSGVQRIVRDLLLGYPIEATAYLMDR